jgi:hypothetical protein
MLNSDKRRIFTQKKDVLSHDLLIAFPTHHITTGAIIAIASKIQHLDLIALLEQHTGIVATTTLRIIINDMDL